ncbi:Retinitis pigmentosa 9 protein, partial [Acropora cervicornis]
MADKTSKSMKKRERNREKKENKKRKRSDVDDTELDCIPDLPENKDARQFLAHAPSKGLWMPLGKEVKVMKCWRCKAYGHRTGDRECPLFISGNKSIEKFRMAHEDPMHEIEQLKALLEESTTSESDGDDSSVDSSSSEEEKKKGNR